MVLHDWLPSVRSVYEREREGGRERGGEGKGERKERMALNWINDQLMFVLNKVNSVSRTLLKFVPLEQSPVY
jgi:hypothetical protein